MALVKRSLLCGRQKDKTSLSLQSNFVGFDQPPRRFKSHSHPPYVAVTGYLKSCPMLFIRNWDN